MPALSPAFLAARPKANRGFSRGALASLEVRLVERAASARAAWPGVELDDEAFAAHLGERAQTEPELERLHSDDLYLACACLKGVSQALAAFESAFLARIDPHVRRYDPAAAFADEVRQILRERFFVWADGAPPRIAGYTGRGALGPWVRVAAVRVALRLAERQEAPAPGLDSMLVPDPELDYLRARYRNAFSSALSEALGSLTLEERNLLRLHFVDGLTIDGLAPLFQVHRSTAARRLAEAREHLFEATRARLQAALNVSSGELESLLGVVRSRIEVSLTSLFKRQSAGDR